MNFPTLLHNIPIPPPLKSLGKGSAPKRFFYLHWALLNCCLEHQNLTKQEHNSLRSSLNRYAKRNKVKFVTRKLTYDYPTTIRIWRVK